MFPDLTRDEVFMIGTDRLWLRWPRLADADRFAAVNGHPDVARMTASWPTGCDAAFALERIVKMRASNATGTSLTLAIARRGDWFRAIGTIGASVTVDPATRRMTASIGYALDPALAGQGLMTEAVTGLVDMTRLLTRTERVRAGVMPHNPASMRVLEKCGFVRGDVSTFQSPIKGAIEIIDFERSLRARALDQRLAQPVSELAAVA